LKNPRQNDRKDLTIWTSALLSDKEQKQRFQFGFTVLPAAGVLKRHNPATIDVAQGRRYIAAAQVSYHNAVEKGTRKHCSGGSEGVSTLIFSRNFSEGHFL
jgi:hypothetical protein